MEGWGWGVLLRFVWIVTFCKAKEPKTKNLESRRGKKVKKFGLFKTPYRDNTFPFIIFVLDS